MTASELAQIVDQRMDDPAVLGRLACNLRSNESVVQRHHDDRVLAIRWKESGDCWRCTVSSSHSPADRLAEIHLHANATVRMEIFAPCTVTISPDEDFLCLTLLKAPRLSS